MEGMLLNTFDIKSDMPDVREAGKRLAEIIRASKGQQAIKIIHGYGSTGVGGVIRNAVRKSLAKRVRNHEIKAYIPGEAFVSLMGFDDVIRTYKARVAHDADARSGNPGVTYVIL